MTNGIPFVPLECQLDEKFEYIEAEFGMTGFAVVVKLFQRIYGGHGYYCDWNDRVALLFSHNTGADADAVRAIVSAAVREGIFDGEMLAKQGILTSHGIQRRYRDVAKRRRQIFDKPQYILLSKDELPRNADIPDTNAHNPEQNADISATSKAKQSNASECNATECNATESSERSAHTTADLRTTLAEEYGEQAVAEYERKFRLWQSQNGAKASLYPTISKWLKADGVTPPVNNSSFDVNDIMRNAMKKYENF